jgi:hypothetical protein
MNKVSYLSLFLSGETKEAEKEIVKDNSNKNKDLYKVV